MVVNGEFFARLQVAQTHIDNVALDDAGGDIRIAAMVDILRARAVDRAVNSPIRIEGKKII
mgnify:CR=1 FL=1